MPAGEKDRGAVSLLCELNTNLQSKSVRLAIPLLTDRRLSAATGVNLLDRLLCLQNAVDFFLFIFNWFMIAWQYWFDFCRTSAGMNHGCTCVPSLLNLLLTSHPFPPLQVITEPSHGKSQALSRVSRSFPEIPPFLFPGSLMVWWPSLHPDFSETAFYLHLLFQWFFFFSQNFYQVWTQGSCSVF